MAGVDLNLNQGASIASRIFLRFRSFEEVIFKHVFRETNMCADFMTKLDLPRSVKSIWLDDYPVELS